MRTENITRNDIKRMDVPPREEDTVGINWIFKNNKIKVKMLQQLKC